MFEGMGIKYIVQCEWQSTWPSRHLVYDDSCSSRTSEGWRPRTEPCLVRWRPPLARLAARGVGTHKNWQQHQLLLLLFLQQLDRQRWCGRILGAVVRPVTVPGWGRFGLDWFLDELGVGDLCGTTVSVRQQ